MYKKTRLFLTMLPMLLTGCSTKEGPSTNDLKLSQLQPQLPAKVAIAPGPYDELLEKLAGDSNWYGLYMQDQKVGWMESFIKNRETEVEIGSTMFASIRGMGRSTEMTITESHFYNRQTGRMTRMQFSQTSPDQMGMMQSGICQDGNLSLTITTGNQQQVTNGICTSGLEEALAVYKMIFSGAKSGENRVLKNYEPAMMQNVTIQSTITKIVDAIADGVTNKLYYISEDTIDPPGTGVVSTSVYNENGLLLSAEVGGFFTAKLEDEISAKRQSSNRDILVASVVKLPSEEAGDLLYGSYEIAFKGFPADFTLPADSFGQKARRDGELVVLQLTQQKISDHPVTLPLATAPELAPYLQNEPQYQSAAPEIVNLAQKLTAQDKNLWATHRALLDYVYHNLKKAYVPAMANAVDVLKIGKGDCTEHSTLYVALARAAGIPARQAVGIAYWPQGGGFGWHAWAEIWDGSQWLAVDPTWGQVVADPSHLRLASGAMGEQVRISALLGALEIVRLTPTSITK